VAISHSCLQAHKPVDNDRRQRVNIVLENMVPLPSLGRKEKRAVILLLAASIGVLAATPQEVLRPAQNPQGIGLSSYEALVRNDQLPAAERGLRDFLAREPGSAPAHFLLGYVLYRENKPQASLAEYTQGAKFHNPSAADVAAVAMDYILLRDYPDADKWLSQAVRWEPANYLYRYYLGRTQYSENHFSDAAGSFDECLSLRPRDATAEYNLGLVYAGIGDDAKAAGAYRQSIAWLREAQKEDPQPYLDLGILLLQQNKPEEALPTLQDAARIDPHNPSIHEELGVAYEKLSHLASAQEELEKAVSLADKVAALHFELARIYKREGLADKARTEFARSAALHSTHSSDATPTPNPPKHD
jgi:Flp pilus assembly protein TadD